MQQRLAAVEERIAAACARAGRVRDTVKLLAVSKTFGPEAVEEAAGCGLLVFGESKVQEARQKIPCCPSHLQWHCIGHLQSNKIKDAVRLFHMIHAVDSSRLLELIDAACKAAGRTLPVCLEVNVSGESSKYGMPPGDVAATLELANRLFNVQVVGLMSIPPLMPDPEQVRPYFQRLRVLRDDLRDRTGYALPELSMGMSHDFEGAIAEGATWVRIGSMIFGERPKNKAVITDDP